MRTSFRIAEGLAEIREKLETAILEDNVPWTGSLEDWERYFEESLEEEGLEESLKWVKQKYGAQKALAHRRFLQMVRKDPAAHARKMRQDRAYHRKHKWHDALMRRTAKKGFRRVREEFEFDEADADYSLVKKKGADYWYVKRGAVVLGVVSKHGDGYDADTDPSGKGLFKKGFDTPQAAAEWLVANNKKPGATDEAIEMEEQAADTGLKLTDKARSKAAERASKKTGKKVPEHYQKACSLDAFNKNVEYFYRVKGKEWEGTKQEKLQRAIAASYSVLKRSCGVDASAEMTPSEIVKAGSK